MSVLLLWCQNFPSVISIEIAAAPVRHV